MRSWFRKPPDPLAARARDLGTALDRRLMDEFPAIRRRVPILETAAPEAWRRYATVAAASLTVFPLLRVVKGDVARYQRLVEILRAGLREIHPEADTLWNQAEHSTVPPTGREQTLTLAQVDETQGLALARWALIGLVGPDPVGRSWQDVQELARAFRAAVEGYWSRD